MSSVREDIAMELCLYCHEHDDEDGTCTADPQPCQAALVTADTILSHPRIAILSEDQSLPGNPIKVTKYLGLDEDEARVRNTANKLLTSMVQEQMLKAKFRRIEVKDE